MSDLKKYFKNQITGIANSRALRIYGACVAMGNVLSVLYWILRNETYNLSKAGEPLCWPFFENCFQFRIFDAPQIYGLLLAFGILALAGAIFFLVPRYCGLAYGWLIGISLLKTFIYLQDFQLRLNQHYMLYFVTLVFLFIPNKKDTLRYLLVSFYFASSWLKYNPQWLSGQTLYANPLGISSQWLPAAAAYVVVLESFLVFGLLLRNKWIFWGTFAQLFLFHLVSWPVVGFFYPSLMFFLLAIFPLAYFEEKRADRESLAMSLMKGHQPLITYFLLVIFFGLQLIPKFMPGDTRLTGEGRLFALHMFDAKIYCDGNISLKFKNKSVQNIPIPKREKRGARYRCDPITNFSRAKWYCWKYQNDPDFLNLNLKYAAALDRNHPMRTLVDIPDFCGQDIHYNMLRPNKWILKYPNLGSAHIRPEENIKKYDIVFSTSSSSNSSIAQILNNLQATLSSRYAYKIKILYGQRPGMPAPKTKNFFWVINDFVNVRMSKSEQDATLEPWILLGQFPLVLVHHQSGRIETFDALLEEAKTKKDFHFITNSQHPIATFLTQRLALHKDFQPQIIERYGLSEFIKSVISLPESAAFIPPLTFHSYFENGSIRPLAACRPLPAFANVPDLSQISPDLGVTQNVILYTQKGFPGTPRIESQVEQAVFSPQFENEISRYSINKPSKDETLIREAIKENYGLYLKYQPYLKETKESANGGRD